MADNGDYDAKVIEKKEPESFLDRVRRNWLFQGTTIALAFLIALGVIRDFFDVTVPWLGRAFDLLSKVVDPTIAGLLIGTVVGVVGLTIADLVLRADLGWFERDRKAEQALHRRKLDDLQAESDRVLARVAAIVAESKGHVAQDKEGGD